MLFEKMRNGCRDKKSLALAMAFVVMMSMLTMGAISDKDTKNVTLVQRDCFNDFESTRKFVTRSETVGNFLEEQGVEIKNDDVINAKLSDTLYQNQTITVEKTKMVEVNFDGAKVTARTPQRTVKEAIKDLGITVSENDLVSPERDSDISDGTVINIVRVEYVDETCDSDIPYETVTEENPEIYSGRTTVKQKGSVGTKREVYRVKKVGGEEESRELVSSVTAVEPINEIVSVGTKPVPQGGTWQANAQPAADKSFSYSKVINVTATAYDPSPETNSGYSITAYGLVPQFGVVAVDPRIIPLGSKLYIESPDGGASWTYGYCIAGDTGGAIKGNRVDLCYNTKAECIQFGRRSATVYVLN